jgi:hypothetical protein
MTKALLGRIEVERAAHRSDQALALARTRRAGDATTEDAKARLDIISAEILADRDPAQAVQALLRVPRTAASFAESRLRAAEILRDQNKPAEATKALAEAERRPPARPMTEEITIGQDAAGRAPGQRGRRTGPPGSGAAETGQQPPPAHGSGHDAGTQRPLAGGAGRRGTGHRRRAVHLRGPELLGLLSPPIRITSWAGRASASGRRCRSILVRGRSWTAWAGCT